MNRAYAGQRPAERLAPDQGSQSVRFLCGQFAWENRQKQAEVSGFLALKCLGFQSFKGSQIEYQEKLPKLMWKLHLKAWGWSLWVISLEIMADWTDIKMLTNEVHYNIIIQRCDSILSEKLISLWTNVNLATQCDFCHLNKIIVLTQDNKLGQIKQN